MTHVDVTEHVHNMLEHPTTVDPQEGNVVCEVLCDGQMGRLYCVTKVLSELPKLDDDLKD